MKKFICIISISLFLSFFIGGCFQYKDINRTLFVTTIVIDIDDLKNTIFYVETFISSRGEQPELGKEEKVTFKSESPSIFEASKDLSLNSNYKFDYSQCKSIVFTQKAAEYGMDNFLDFFRRKYDLPLRAYMFISSEIPEDIIKCKMKEEEYAGIFLSELAQNTKLTSKGSALRIDQFLNNRFLGSKVNLINTISIKKEEDPRLCIESLAVINDDKYINTLSKEESMAYNFLNNTFKRGVVNITNPEESDNIASIEVLGNKTKTKLNFDGNTINFKKSIDLKADFAFSQRNIHLTDPQEKNTLEDYGEEYIKEICQKLFYDYKEKNIDILNVQREFEMKYPKSTIDNCVKVTNLELDLDVNIKGSANTINFE